MSRRYGRRGWADRHRPRVLDVAPGLNHESGPVLGREWAPDRVAVMAHWSTVVEPSRSVVTLLQELDAAGFETVLVSAAEAPGSIGRICTWAPGEPAMPERTTVLRRANAGYDFGSWACALASFPGITAASRVLLVNDSLIGPFGPITDLLDGFECTGSLAWGALSANYPHPHLQSFLLGFKDQILRTAPVSGFWSDVRVESGKNKVIRYGELELSELLSEAGVGWQAAIVPPNTFELNPAVHAPRALIRRGFPFLKSGVVNGLQSEDQWDGLVAEVMSVHGVDLASWLERPIKTRLSPTRRAATVMELRAVRDLRGPVAAGRHLARKILVSLQGSWLSPGPSRSTEEPSWRVDEDDANAPRS